MQKYLDRSMINISNLTGFVQIISRLFWFFRPVHSPEWQRFLYGTAITPPVCVQESTDRSYPSRDHAGQLFRNASGISITAMIQEVRIDHANKVM